MSFSLNFSTKVEESWELDGVGEGKTSSGWETNGEGKIVVEFGVVESVAIGSLSQSILKI